MSLVLRVFNGAERFDELSVTPDDEHVERRLYSHGKVERELFHERRECVNE